MLKVKRLGVKQGKTTRAMIKAFDLAGSGKKTILLSNELRQDLLSIIKDIAKKDNEISCNMLICNNEEDFNECLNTYSDISAIIVDYPFQPNLDELSESYDIYCFKQAKR